MASFYGWGSTASRLEPLWGGSLLFTTKFPEISGTHFVGLGRMKGWVDLGAIRMGFWMWSFYLVNPIIIVQKYTNKLENYEVGQYWNTYYQWTKNVFLYSQIKSRCFYLLVGYAAVLYSCFGAQISRPAQNFSTVSPFLSKMSIFIKDVFFFKIFNFEKFHSK